MNSVSNPDVPPAIRSKTTLSIMSPAPFRPELTKPPPGTHETVQNLGVITPLNETDAGSNFRLRHAHGGGVPRPVQPAVYGGGRPIRAKTYGKKREHGRKSGNFGR